MGKRRGLWGKENLFHRPARGGEPGLLQSLGERWNFSVCSSWPGSIHLLRCLCSELLKPGPSLQRLCQPSGSAWRVNAQQGSEKAALSLCVRCILSENPQDSSPCTDIPRLMGKSPVSALQAVRLKLTQTAPKPFTTREQKQPPAKVWKHPWIWCHWLACVSLTSIW